MRAKPGQSSWRAEAGCVCLPFFVCFAFLLSVFAFQLKRVINVSHICRILIAKSMHSPSPLATRHTPMHHSLLLSNTWQRNKPKWQQAKCGKNKFTARNELLHYLLALFWFGTQNVARRSSKNNRVLRILLKRQEKWDGYYIMCGSRLQKS